MQTQLSPEAISNAELHRALYDLKSRRADSCAPIMLHVLRTVSATLGCVPVTEINVCIPEIVTDPVGLISCASWVGVVLVGTWPVAEKDVQSQQLRSSRSFKLNTL